MLITAILLVLVLVAYWFWVRPILRSRPSLAEFWRREDDFLAALKLKFKGLKQKLTAALIVLGGIVVMLHDMLAPLLATVDTTPLTAQLPSWAWPLIVICATLLLQYFRSLADKRAE